jgi:Tfp pilus assembly protein PilO
MKLKKNETLLVYAVAGLVGLLFVPRVIFGPFHEKLAGLTRDVVLEEARLKKGTNLEAKKNEIVKEYEKYATYFSLQGFSDEEVVANLLKEIEQISRSSGLTILDMKPQKEVKSDKFSKQYLISVKAEANMQKLVKFLFELQSSQLLFSVEKMSVAPKSEESPDLSIALTLVGVSFL